MVRRSLGPVLALALLLCAPAAEAAQTAYVANSGSNSISVLNAATGQAIAPPIAVGGSPTEVAFVPDASRAYVTNSASDTISVIDVASGSAIATIAVGDEPIGVAVSPGGSRAYVTNKGDDTVSVVDVASSAVLGPPILVGDRPEGIALLPTRDQALVAQRSGDVAVIDLPTRSVIGVIADSLGPSRLVVTPDGARGFAANADSNSLTFFGLVVNAPLGAPILVGANPSGIALSPDGHAYAASASENTVSAVDAITHARVGAPIGGFASPAGVAAAADGATVLVANSATASVSVLDTRSASVIGQVPVGSSPQGIAIAPDQPPRASFTAAHPKDKGQLFSFDASSSSDPDSQIASYTWSFGDGESETTFAPIAEHAYAEPGVYDVTLTTVDQAGCSTSLFFTGQTVTCNGSPLATTAQRIVAPDTVAPALRLAGGHRQILRPRVKLTIGCPKESCRAKLTGVLRAKAKTNGPAKRAKLSIPAKRASIVSGGKTTIGVRLGKQAYGASRRSLRSGGEAKLTIKVIAEDAAGNSTTRKFAIQLVPGRR